VRRFLDRLRIASVADGNKSSLGRPAVIGGQLNDRFMSIVCGTALILATSGAVFAADMAVKAPPPAPPPSVWGWSGSYIGVGGSFNWSHFDQSLQSLSRIINVFNGPVLVAQGQEGGPFSTSTETNPVSPPMSSSAIWFRFPAATGCPGSNSPTNTQTLARRR
jgi:hypothetical protein